MCGSDTLVRLDFAKESLAFYSGVKLNPKSKASDRSVRPTRARLNPRAILWHHLSMPKIHIPTPLRQYAGKQPAVDVNGSTVGEALSGLVTQHPDLRRHLYTDEGKLRAFVNVYLNDEDVRYLQKDATAVQDGDNISIVPSIAGGAASSC